MKRRLSPSAFAFIERELSYLEQQKVITSEESKRILAQYEIKERPTVFRMLWMIGSLLIGLGILSFIAGNWSYLPAAGKFSLILFGLIICFWLGRRNEAHHPKTSRSMYYIAVFLYGAGIFLVGQMFHLGSDLPGAFVLWTVGILPLIIYLQDRYIALLSIVLMSFAILGAVTDGADRYLWVGIIYLFALYGINEKLLQQSKLVFAFTNVYALTIVGSAYGLWATVDVAGFVMIFHLIGVMMIFLPIHHYRSILHWQGVIISGITGLIMTYPEYWDVFDLTILADQTLAQIFTGYFVIFLLILFKKKQRSAILIMGLVVFRFYVDLSLGFLSKSFFFIFGGLILLGFSFWFEKTRRKERRSDDNHMED